MLFDSFDHAMQDESAARQSESVEMERFCNLQRSKFGMSTNLPRHGPKWKSPNYRLGPRIGGEYKEDKYLFRN